MTGAVRWARALVLAAWTVALGVLVHAAGGGSLPSASLSGLMVGVVALLAAPALEREQGLPTLLAWTLLTQAGVHLALLHHAPQPGLGGAGALGHLLAAALLAGWLRAGEAAVCRLLGRLLPRLPQEDGPFPVPPPCRGRAAGQEPVRAGGRSHAGVVGLRAPPVDCAPV